MLINRFYAFLLRKNLTHQRTDGQKITFFMNQTQLREFFLIESPCISFSGSFALISLSFVRSFLLQLPSLIENSRAEHHNCDSFWIFWAARISGAARRWRLAAALCPINFNKELKNSKIFFCAQTWELISPWVIRLYFTMEKEISLKFCFVDGLGSVQDSRMGRIRETSAVN